MPPGKAAERWFINRFRAWDVDSRLSDPGPSDSPVTHRQQSLLSSRPRPSCSVSNIV